MSAERLVLLGDLVAIEEPPEPAPDEKRIIAPRGHVAGALRREEAAGYGFVDCHRGTVAILGHAVRNGLVVGQDVYFRGGGHLVSKLRHDGRDYVVEEVAAIVARVEWERHL